MTTELDMQSDFVPADWMVVEDLDTLKVLADPLRLRIRELLHEPMTVKQISAELDIPATKLYYHINLLEKHNLIVVVGRRVVSGIIEKQYQVAARLIRVSRKLLSPSSAVGDESMTVTLNSLFEDVRADLLQSLHDGVVDMDQEAEAHRSLSVASNVMFLTESQAAAFYEQLSALLRKYQEISDAQENDPHTGRYKVLHALFPSSRRRRPPSDPES